MTKITQASSILLAWRRQFIQERSTGTLRLGPGNVVVPLKDSRPSLMSHREVTVFACASGGMSR